MDEISYWIYTKRAPCLFSFDRVANKGGMDVFCPKAKSVHTIVDDPVTPEKKRRKLSLLDEKSMSTVERQHNLYFDVSQIKIPHLDKSEYKSDTVGSDIDFNVKKPSVQDKRKRTKLLKTPRTTLHKKNKPVTSTPKTTTLRRSLRKAQNCLNNNSQLNSSFEVLNYNVKGNIRSRLTKTAEDKLNLIEMQTGVDQTMSSKHHNDRITKPTILANDQYEDMSDVSGFTANYIRSTKIHSTKTQRKLKSKAANRNLMRESHHSTAREEGRMIVCVNKAVNTGIPQNPMLNCSTDSSQNVLNSVTVKNNNRCKKLDKSTSELKFIDPKINSNINTGDVLDTSKETVDNADILFPSRTSRYPKRHKNNLTNSFIMTTDKMNSPNTIIINRRRKVSKNSIQYDNSDRKENPEENITRTRSGRNSGLTLRQPENSVLVLSNSAEQVSSRASINVASPRVAVQQCDNRKRRKRVSARQLELKRSMDNCHSSRRESLRDRSGFAACFSDSDDSEPLKQKKFFC